MAKLVELPEWALGVMRSARESFPGYVKADIILETGHTEVCRTIKGNFLIMRETDNFVVPQIIKIVFYQ